MRALVLAACGALLVSPPARAGDVRELSGAIDAKVDTALAKEGVRPAPRAEPHELVRRIYLDVLGRIPTADEAGAYLKDAREDRHHRLIDELLASAEMPAYWRGVFHQWLNGALDERRPGEDEFLAYLQKRLEENAPWDKVAREMLDPDESDPVGRGASYFLASRLAGNDRSAQLDAMTVAVSSTYFGVQLQCAKCHDHPTVDKWTQENYYGIAAFFARTATARAKSGSGTVLTEKPDGEVKYTGRKTGEATARLLFLDGTVSEAKGGRRKALVAAGVNAESPYLKRAMANRVWKHLMGVGLVEPVDQIHDANPASHPELLDLLAADFAANNFDLRRLLGGVLHSEAYLRSSRWAGPGPRPADRTYAVAALKPLSPPQLALSLAHATGYAEVLRARYQQGDKSGPGAAVTPGGLRVRFEKEREYAALAARFKQEGEGFQANASHALFLTYNPVVQKMLKPGAGSLVTRLAGAKDDEAARLAYLAVLSRPPAAAEADAVAKYLATPGVAREELCRDIVWALLAGSEFRFNH
ncbi:DUF1549 domain-containing protein [Gemmata sp.]|uniref:DUF1549 domain-containing protein n=1 Tax=Gemmata sp. TaxID=1914242 RepID=UPI003F6FCC93